MENIKKALDKIISSACVIVFILMVLFTTFQVTVRYVFKSPSSTSETITRYLFVWLIILSATYVFGKRDHICISYVKDKMNESIKRIMNIIGEVIIIFFSLTIMVYGGIIVSKMNMLQFDSILGIPTGLIYSIIPICGVIIIFYSIFNIMIYLGKMKEDNLCQ